MLTKSSFSLTKTSIEQEITYTGSIWREGNTEHQDELNDINWKFE